MDVPSWLESAIKQELGDNKIDPNITFKKKKNELFVGYVWRFDDVTETCVTDVSNETEQCSIPKFSTEKNSDVSVSPVNNLSATGSASDQTVKKHKSPCRMRRNRRKLAELKRKIAERKSRARALAGEPPVSTDSTIVAGSPVAVNKTPAVLKNAGAASGTDVVKPELSNRKSQRIIEKSKIDIDSLEVTCLPVGNRYAFHPKCCGCQTTLYFTRRWICCQESYNCKYRDYVCENCFSKSRCVTNGRCKMKRLEFKQKLLTDVT